MREVVINASCDACFQEDETKTPSDGSWTAGVVAGENGRPALKVLDLCERHGKLMLDLLELLSSTGTLPMVGTEDETETYRLPSALRQVPCPVCAQECPRATLAAHVWKQHRKDDKPDMGTVCPECDYESQAPAGLAAHRRGVHDYSALEEALRGVKGYRITGREREL